MNKDSIIKKIAIAIVIPLFLQAGLFLLTILDSGIIPALKENSISHFKDKGNSKHIYLQNQMLQNWSNISNEVEYINSNILENLKNKGLSTDELNSNDELSNEILINISKNIMNIVRENYTTNIFLILDTKQENQGTSDLIEKNGIYIKDIDPILISENNSDLYIERGPRELINNLKINTDSNWKSKYFLNKEESENNFFYKPMKKYNKGNGIDIKKFGYWGKPSIITNENIKVTTYSIPLIDSEGNPYGVLGVGVDSDYINKMFQGYEYIISVENNEMHEEDFNVEGIKSISNESKELLNAYKVGDIKTKKILDDIYELRSKKDVTYVFKKELNLYNEDDQFSNEKWYVTLFLKDDTLFYKIDKLVNSLKVSIIVSTLIGILIALILVRKVTKPTSALAEKVRKSNPREPLKLEKINISEIDDLSLAITTLSRNVADESSKLNKIINLLNMPFGAFKHRKDENCVYCTSGLFNILGIEGLHKDDEYVDLDSFNLIIEEATKNKYESEENVYIIKKENKDHRWIKLLVQEDDIGKFGVITDVT